MDEDEMDMPRGGKGGGGGGGGGGGEPPGLCMVNKPLRLFLLFLSSEYGCYSRERRAASKSKISILHTFYNTIFTFSLYSLVIMSFQLSLSPNFSYTRLSGRVQFI